MVEWKHEDVETGTGCSMRKITDVHEQCCLTTESKKQIEISVHMWEDNIQMWHSVDWIYLAYESSLGRCNDASGSIKSSNFLD